MMAGLMVLGAACGESTSSCPEGEQDRDGDGVCAPACAVDTCGGRGDCDDTSGAAVCTCDPEYAGDDCASCAFGFQDADGDGVCTAGCGDETCGGFGTCSDATGAIFCDCVEGHDGADCTLCRAGYEDVDGDGACEPACGAMQCSGNGTCDNRGGVIVCDCLEGHEGDDCSVCAAGYQDADGDGRCAPGCDDATCSGRGTCDDSSGRVICTCDFGSGGVACDVCAVGFQDRDGDGTCALACTDTTCSGRGTCDDASGAAVCTCDEGFTGARCDGCDLGFQDRDGDGVCMPACAADTCAPTGTCDDASGEALCGCDEGYAGDDCSACAAGYQDTDGDGICTAACDDAVCGAGTCDDTTGVLECTCPDGTRGERCEYRRVLTLSMPANADYDTEADIVWDEDLRASVTTFDRLGYRMALDDRWVWTSFDAMTDDPARIGMPVDWIFDQTVTNMDVDSNQASIRRGEGGDGNVEFWGHCFGNRPFGWDADDELQEHRPDCYGSLAVYRDGDALISWMRWSEPGGDDDVTVADRVDAAFARNAGTFTERTLEVFVREARSCADTDCGGGTCDDASGTPVCACPEGTTGLACARCDEATGYQDHDRDGVCELACEGLAGCDGLDTTGLGTGVHDFRTAGGTVPLYVDDDYDGGGWVLVGRGRTGWDFRNAGQGDANDLVNGLGTPEAFEPVYLSTAIVQGLMDRSGVDAQDLEIRLSRADAIDGSGRQEATWTQLEGSAWSWQPHLINTQVDIAFSDSALGAGASGTVRLGNAQLSNDHNRFFMYRWNNHDGIGGFSYGSAVSGSSTDGSFLWEFAREGHAIAYAEVYVRLRCPAGTRGAACDLCAYPAQDHDGDGVCAPSCAETVCGAGEGCVDASGTATCIAAAGASCADILAGDAGAGDGSYAIDPDGAGGADPIGVQCDMTGGGWTILHRETFTSGYARGWNRNGIDTSNCHDVFGTFLGRYRGADDLNKTFDVSAVPHTEARVSLDYLVIDSWDTEDGVVEVEGVEVWRETFLASDATNRCGGSWGDHGPQPVFTEFAHASDTIEVRAYGTINQGVSDESYGVDDVTIAVR